MIVLENSQSAVSVSESDGNVSDTIVQAIDAVSFLPDASPASAIIESRILATALSLVALGAAKRTSLPVLTHFRMQGFGHDRLSMESTDLERWIRVEVGAAVQGNLDCTLPVQSVKSVIPKAKNTLIEIIDKGERQDTARCNDHTRPIAIESSTGGSQTYLSYDAEEFPVFPRMDRSEPHRALSIGAQELAGILGSVIPACAPDDARPVLTGIQIKKFGGAVKFIATDTHRLHIGHLQMDLNTECRPFVDDRAREWDMKAGADVVIDEKSEPIGDQGIIIPACAISTMNAILSTAIKENPGVITTLDYEAPDSEKSGHIRLSVTTDTMTIQFVSRCIEGQYPSYERVVPQHTDICVIVNTEAIKAAVKDLSTIAKRDGYANRLTLTINAGAMTLEAGGHDARGQRSVDCIAERTHGYAPSARGECSGKRLKINDPELQVVSGFKMAFNCSYLMDALASVASDTCMIEITEPLRPAVISSGSRDELFIVLMPMQVI